MRMTIGSLTLVLLLAGCSGDSGTRVLGATDTDTTITAAVGDVIAIELESNPSTGYSWIVPDDPAGMILRDERWIGDSDLAGAPGTTRFEFEVTDPGTWTIHLEYRRPWRPDDVPERSFTVVVNAG